MNHHSTRFRSALDQLTSDFVEGVLQAFRDASLEEFLEFLAEISGSPRSTLEPATSAAPARRRGRPSKGERRTGAASPSRADVEEHEHEASDPSSVITDPGLILAALASAPEPTSRALPAILDDAEPPPSAPASEPTPAAPAARRDAAPAVRPGEEVLRTAGGGHVLRRRPRSAVSGG